MIDKKTLNFLALLSQNNNKEWFTEHKNLYLESKENVISFVEKIIQNISEFDGEIIKIDAKKSVFRIYRDVRFSKNKLPYKTNFGANLGIGNSNHPAGYYLHIEPGKSFLAGGIYMPEPEILKNIRTEISAFSDEFLEIIENKNFKDYFKNLDQSSKLKMCPKGFDKDHKMIEYLKLKNFTISYPISDEKLIDKASMQYFIKIYKAMKPFNDFLNRVTLY